MVEILTKSSQFKIVLLNDLNPITFYYYRSSSAVMILLKSLS